MYTAVSSSLLLVIVTASVINALSPILIGMCQYNNEYDQLLRSPMINFVVPGYTGSRLQANIADPSGDCDTGGIWVTFWINVNQSVKCINKVLT